MCTFTYEEQGTKKYLIYEKKEEDKLDIITKEMLSNNRIEGIVPFDSVQIDDSVYMRYDITGLVNLQEYLAGIVKKKKLFEILESMIDDIVLAEDYMLELSEYVFDKSYIYVNPETKQISMLVLPVVNEGSALDVFFKDLIFGIQHDQNEDCSHVAAFINFFQSRETFSIEEFRKLVSELKKKENERKENTVKRTEEIVHKLETPEKKSEEKSEEVHFPKKRLHFDKNMMDILYSDVPSFEPGLEVPEKEKRGFFRRKEKEEKPDKQEKRSFFGKKADKKNKEKAAEDKDAKNIFGHIAIPGMSDQDLLFGEKQSEEKKSEVVVNNCQKLNIGIPMQNIEMQKHEVDMQDFGETLYLDGSEEETVFLNQKEEVKQPKFMIYRYSTKESFEIKGEIIRVGRNPNITEICISGNRSVGRIHAVLYVQENQVYIEDNDSKNGTFVNDKEIRHGMGQILLENGAKIRMGDEEMEFQVYE